MLFNSYSFIFAFLPLTLLGFFWLARYEHKLAAAWLAAASLFFYGWWNIAYVGLLLGSIAFNYTLGVWIARGRVRRQAISKGHLLTFAVAANLSMLAYYKYANFFLETLNDMVGTGLDLGTIILPLGISFFTFTQIAFLVDTYRGGVKEYNFLHYSLFVTYFPHLIAGPILHHKEIMPQFSKTSTYRLDPLGFSVGLSIFAIGLFKKTVLADGVAPHADTIFAAAAQGGHPGLLQAWGGVLAYSVQLYFDFSGYSDMAIGLSRMFGIVLPLNFYSPYQALNIIDFWRRWHMTLSRFLRDYLYIPLGGSRSGRPRRYLNLGITMVLGGLWHGAGWTYVAWGALHGVFLLVNHVWQELRKALGQELARSAWTGRLASRFVTLLGVTVAWVFFRATNFQSATQILKGICGLNGLFLPIAVVDLLGPLKPLFQRLGGHIEMGGGGEFVSTYAWILALWSIVLFAPNTSQIMRHFTPGLDYPPKGITEAFRSVDRIPAWNLSLFWAVITGLLAACGLLSLAHVSPFLYFQF